MMKKIILMLSLMFSNLSQAALIEVELDKDNYEINEIVYGQLVVSDFAKTLGWFTAILNYDSANLELLDWQFGTGFGNGLTDDESNLNSLFLDESTLYDLDEGHLLASLQGDSFMLASFSFRALTAGLQSITFDKNNSRLEFFDYDPVSTQFTGASFNINDNSSTPVPAPATLLLFISGLALIRTKRKIN